MTHRVITISIIADTKLIPVEIPAGSSVREALNEAQLTLGDADRVDPPVYTILNDSIQVKVIRVREETYAVQEVIPFEQQEIRNEVLPEGEQRLSQPGVNGLQEVTYHQIIEDGIEISNNIIKKVVIQEAIPEVVMIGSHSNLSSIDIPGKMAYLSAGNAWVIERSTKNQSLVVSTGDLDGRVFTLSKDGKFLLFTRFSHDEKTINSLWMASLQEDSVALIDLGVKNVVHFADFNPISTTIAYSTVEWRETPPGWQANNDLYELYLDENGRVSTRKEIIAKNSGGLYGWWGTNYLWNPDGRKLLVVRPEGLRIFDIYDKKDVYVYPISPLQTGGSWAWMPSTSWSPDGTTIYTIVHDTSGVSSAEIPPQFDLIAVPLTGESTIHLATDVGIFANPVTSPISLLPGEPSSNTGLGPSEGDYSIAFLHAMFPDQSESGTYRISVMDRDGSNQRPLFPREGMIGLEPQKIVWSPGPIDSDNSYAIAFIYNGNIWLVNTISGAVQQISENGSYNRLDWR